MTRLGVDPGLHGAWALLDGGRLITAGDFPLKDGEIDALALASLWRELGPACATVETVGAMTRNAKGKKMGVRGRFKFGQRYQLVLTVLDMLGIARDGVEPHVWKRATGVTADKATSLRAARALWPAHADTLFRLGKHEGRAEAALIARYGQARAGRLGGVR